MLKRIPWVAVAVCLLIVSILLALQQSLYPWPKRLRHVRLEPSRPILRDADVTPDNAFFYLRQVRKLPAKTSDDWWNEHCRFNALGMRGVPYPALEAELTELTGNLELCRQAAGLPKCQVATVDSLDVPMAYVGLVRDAIWSFEYRAEEGAAKSDWVAAGDGFRIALRTGDHVSRGGCLLHHRIMCAGGISTCQSLRRVAIERDPPPEFLRGMIRLLTDIDRHIEPFAEAMRSDSLFEHGAVRHVNNRVRELWDLFWPWDRDTFFVWQHEGFDRLLTPFVLPLAGSTPSRTTAHLDAIYSHVIDIADEPRPTGRSVADEALGFLADGHESVRVLCSDPLGRMWAKLLVPKLDDACAQHRVYVATLRGTELVLALRLYQRTHDGKLPARLDELVPDCLAAVPVDPFSPDGAGFLYRVEAGGKWIVYSHGPNLRDDGALWNYVDEYNIPREHRGSLDVIFSASEFEQRRDGWRLEHPGEK